MRRTAGLVAACVTLIALPQIAGCSRTCTATAYSIASGSVGEPTAADAVATWLRSPQQGFNSDVSAWVASGSDPLVFSDGTGKITVMHASGNASGYFVEYASTCMS
jgi:hypothetical protein